MKSGGPWNLRGLRPEARDAARRSGMSVGEWLTTVVELAEAEEDETRWSDDAEERSADRSARRGKEEFRDREARRQPEPSQRRREHPSDETRRKSPQDDNERMFEQDRDRMPRHRNREPDEPQWRARTGESEASARHRNQRDRFRDSEADEPRSQFIPAGDEFV